MCFFFFFFNDTATTEIYTLSLHDALPISWRGVFSQNGPQRSGARRCCAAKRTLHGEDRSEILDKRERGGPKWTAKMAQSLTASDKMGTRYARQLIPIPGRVMIFSISFAVRVGRFCFLAFTTGRDRKSTRLNSS